MSGPRPALPLGAMVVLLAATQALAACGAGAGGSGSPLPHVAEFALGADTPDAREFVLTPAPGSLVQVVPEPVPPMTPVPDLEEDVLPELSSPPEPEPEPGGQLPAEPAFQPSVAWVDDGRYLAVVTFGSGSCPSGPERIQVVADQEIEIHLGPLFPDRDVCSADMRGHVTVVELPAGITPAEPLGARFGQWQVTIPAIGR